MSSLLRLLTTGDGADVVVFCKGDLFFVHKEVIAAQSPVLEQEIINLQAFDGEACVLNGISPDTFRNVLAFLYRGEITQYEGLRNRAVVLRDLKNLSQLSRRFPGTDRFITTLKVKPAEAPDGITCSTARKTFSNEEIWALMARKQAWMNRPYDYEPCRNIHEVTEELNNFEAANKLQIKALKQFSMQKILGWVEEELQKGSPLSADFHLCADRMLRGNKDFATPFLSLVSTCAEFLPTIETDDFLTSLLEDLHPDTWNLLVSVRSHWKEDMSKTLKEHGDEVQLLKAHLAAQRVAIETIERGHEAQVKALKESLSNAQLDNTKVAAYKIQVKALEEALSSAQVDTKVAQLTSERLGSLNKCLQEEVLAAKASALQARENKRLRPDHPVQKQVFPNEIKDLKQAIATKEQALRQSRSATDKVKGELKAEIAQLKDRLENNDEAFGYFMSEVNDYGKCAGCLRRWNIRIDKSGDSICVKCKLCSEKIWFSGSKH